MSLGGVALFMASEQVTRDEWRDYAVSLDDQRFLMVREVGERDPGEIIVVENWFQELAPRVAASR